MTRYYYSRNRSGVSSSSVSTRHALGFACISKLILVALLLVAPWQSSSYCSLRLVQAQEEATMTGAAAADTETASSTAGDVPPAARQPESSSTYQLTPQQREQLVKIETAILNSPDPKDTLLQVARINEVHPEQLLTLIEQNRREIDSSVWAGISGAGAMPNDGSLMSRNPVLKVLGSIGMVIAHFAARNPRLFALITITVILALIVALSAEKTGLVLSNHRGVISRGPTTLLNPPSTYLQQRMEIEATPYSKKSSNSFIRSKESWNEMVLDLVGTKDGTHWLDNLDRTSSSSNKDKGEKKDKKSPAMAQAAITQVSIPAIDFLRAEEAEDEQYDPTLLDSILEVSLDHASELLSNRLLTEFVDPPHSLRLVCREDKGGRRKHAMLVVNKMGDWNRFGIMPLQIMQVTDNDELSLTLSTTHPLGTSHWDGHIHVSIHKDADSNSVQVRTILIVPKKGNKISKPVALRIVEGLSQSMVQSIKTRTKQSVARRHQSSRFMSVAKERAAERRKTRVEQERAMEDMSEERRRRWQRQNPNAGRYTPSGDRLKSPVNAVY